MSPVHSFKKDISKTLQSHSYKLQSSLFLIGTVKVIHPSTAAFKTFISLNNSNIYSENDSFLIQSDVILKVLRSVFDVVRTMGSL